MMLIDHVLEFGVESSTVDESLVTAPPESFLLLSSEASPPEKLPCHF